jgi:hypothetical protein
MWIRGPLEITPGPLGVLSPQVGNYRHKHLTDYFFGHPSSCSRYGQFPRFSGSSFYDASLVTRLYSVDEKVTSNYEHTRTKTHALSGIQTHSLSVQAIKAYASDRAATGAGRQFPHLSVNLYKCTSGILDIGRQRAVLVTALCTSTLAPWVKTIRHKRVQPQTWTPLRNKHLPLVTLNASGLLR